MKKYTSLVFLVLVITSTLLGCQTQKEPCGVDEYRSNAQPIMNEFEEITMKTDINNKTSRAQARDKLLILQAKASRVACREKFPLKHETLEYSIKHLLDALDYADNNQYEEASRSIDYTLVNFERFNDWTVDVGE